MLLSKAYIPTQKENPVDAVIPSHQLMLRAGLIRQLTAGVYSYLPMGWRVMKKVMQIIREEMDRIGGQELLLPMLNPVEIWDESGRNTDFGDAMFRLKDRRSRTLVLAPTHEEVICDLARKFIHSYKDLPQVWYQIQTKFRDEPRPRSGVIRTRQFIMKDSYTLDRDETGLDSAYEKHAQAYHAIFTRCGLRFHRVGASSGLMGGSGSQEFMVESPFGEDTIVLCGKCHYSANLEVATSLAPKGIKGKSSSVKKVHTPGKKTIAEVSQFLNLDARDLMKSMMYMFGDEPVLILLHGNDEINESKLQSALGQGRPAHPEEVLEISGAPAGFIGPLGLKRKIRIIADNTLKEASGMVAGANEADYHYRGIEISRDFDVQEFMDFRNVAPGDLCTVCQEPLRVVNTIELGHIFKLGTKYSQAMNATYLDAQGKQQPIVMGSYGIGVERIIASAIEQNYDEKGIVWNPVLAPYHVHIIPIQMENDSIRTKAFSLYQELNAYGMESILDDRTVSPGFKFKDADLMGIPVQVILGEKSIQNDTIEIKERKTGKKWFVKESEVISQIKAILESPLARERKE